MHVHSSAAGEDLAGNRGLVSTREINNGDKNSDHSTGRKK